MKSKIVDLIYNDENCLDKIIELLVELCSPKKSRRPYFMPSRAWSLLYERKGNKCWRINKMIKAIVYGYNRHAARNKLAVNVLNQHYGNPLSKSTGETLYC